MKNAQIKRQAYLLMHEGGREMFGVKDIKALNDTIILKCKKDRSAYKFAKMFESFIDALRVKDGSDILDQPMIVLYLKLLTQIDKLKL